MILTIKQSSYDLTFLDWREQPPARDDCGHDVPGWREPREIFNPRGKTAREEILIDKLQQNYYED
jgi:hypothetical protein